MSSSNIYVYKMTNDNGGAPCVFKRRLSLAICKPAIRRSAEKGAILVAFGGKELGERLIYVAEISEAIDGRVYYSDYSDRPDAIYDWNGQQFTWKTGSKFHEGGHYNRDLGDKERGYPNARALLSERFSYWGAAGSDDYKQRFPALKKFVEKMGRGHRVNFPRDVEADLLALVDTELNAPGKHGGPTTPISRPCGSNVSKKVASCAG